jgi:hypothetical protein
MTETEEKARHYEMRQRGRELKTRLVALGDELKRYAAAWRTLGDTFGDHEHNTFRVADDAIQVFRPDPAPRRPGQPEQMNRIADVNIRHFDSQALSELLLQVETVKQELQQARRYCADIGDPID